MERYYFDFLPDEIITYLMMKLPVIDIVNLCQLSSKYDKFIDESL